MQLTLSAEPYKHLLQAARSALGAASAFAADLTETPARVEVAGDLGSDIAAALAGRLGEHLLPDAPSFEWVRPAEDAEWAALRLPADVGTLLVAAATDDTGKPMLLLCVLAAARMWSAEDRELIRHLAADAALHHVARCEALSLKRQAAGAATSLAALQASEQRFRRLVETADLIPWEADVETWQYTYVGPQAKRLLGYAREEWVRPGFWRAHVHPEDRDWVIEFVDRQLEAAPHYELEYRMFAADGRVVWIYEVVGLALDEHGQPQLRGAMQDVTERHRAEEQLRFQNALLEAESEASPNGLLVISTDNRVITFNHRFREVWNIPEDRLRAGMAGDALLELLYERVQDTGAARARARQLAKDPYAATRSELRLLDGRVLERYTAPVRAGDGTLYGRLWQYHDITQRLRAERSLRENEERFRLMVEGSEQVFFYVHDPEHRFEYLSPSVHDVLGYAPEELVGQPYDVLLTGTETDEIVHQMTHEALDTGARGSTYSAHTYHKDGRTVVLELVESPLQRDGRVVGVQGFARDISARVEADEKMLYAALHDTLTDLPNRALLVDRLQHALQQARPRDHGPAVLFLDLDRFKLINDSLGHWVGDQVLVELARRLSGSLGPQDTVARLGGDEFIILLDSVRGVDEAIQVAERVRSTFEQPFLLDGQEVFATASIGIAVADAETEAEADQPETFLRNADIAMYRAKAAGGGNFQVFDTAMHEAAMRLLRLETDLRRALDQNQFLLVFQPVVDPDVGTVMGVEALVRWQHPDRGLLLPAEFIHTAEENGLIVPLGLWVLREACKRAAEWRRLPGLGSLRMHVNLSARQFVQPNLLDEIDAALLDTGLEGAGLSLEITESVIIEHEDEATATLAALKRRGVRVCIDDFGVGYSSLSYLQRFRVDTLKIDRSFIDRIGGQGKNVEIVRAILALARDLDMEVVAEGVETETQREELVALGCPFAQGFLFAPPLDERATLRVLEETNAP